MASPPGNYSEVAPVNGGGRTESGYGFKLVEHKGFLYLLPFLQGAMAMCDDFQSRPDDVFLCSYLKTGTTWMKAILASIMSKPDVLKQNNPHDLIPSVDIQLYGPFAMPHASHVLAEMPSPRVFHTHVPYNALPEGIKSYRCRIIYIARNPKDTFVSYWKFLNKNQAAFDVERELSKGEVFDDFCSGVSNYGPFLDHVLSFWNPSRDNSNILFLTYEDLMADASYHIRRIEDFLGRSSLTEEEIDHIARECSFGSLTSLDVNRNGKVQKVSNMILGSSSFFRKGEVGDWKNHFDPEMNSRFDPIIEKKMKGSGLFFKYELKDIKNVD